MPMHKFQVGQIVRAVPAFAPGAPSPGIYEVIRRLPWSGGPVQYRVKGSHETHERVVDETALTDRLGAPQPGRVPRERLRF